MSHMILGLFGMILSVWMSIGAFIALSFEFHIIRSTYILLLSMCLMFLSYFTFCSAKTNLYVRLPSDQLPFSGIKLYTILFGLFHLAVAIAMVYLMKNCYICLLLIAFSFIFCCDAYSCLFTDVYMLCEHREHLYQMKRLEPVDGIVYNVAVRRVYKTKDKVLSGFDFYDDEIQVDKKWLEDNDKGCYWT
ncbi:hypothetical protein CAEBREN_15761 [Caenorhabditis brenneri]|uniref:Uncharacterized protein n=1 Tax=Caenorhabditis brenneri TaxID=135651 RepID=G0NIL7_CAEBE|nr:hypothetical protein CAEBREN_15761 [Caenorhabditis brenneri]